MEVAAIATVKSMVMEQKLVGFLESQLQSMTTVAIDIEVDSSMQNLDHLAGTFDWQLELLEVAHSSSLEAVDQPKEQ